MKFLKKSMIGIFAGKASADLMCPFPKTILLEGFIWICQCYPFPKTVLLEDFWICQYSTILFRRPFCLKTSEDRLNFFLKSVLRILNLEDFGGKLLLYTYIPWRRGWYESLLERLQLNFCIPFRWLFYLKASGRWQTTWRNYFWGCFSDFLLSWIDFFFFF